MVASDPGECTISYIAMVPIKKLQAYYFHSIFCWLVLTSYFLVSMYLFAVTSCFCFFSKLTRPLRQGISFYCIFAEYKHNRGSKQQITNNKIKYLICSHNIYESWCKAVQVSMVEYVPYITPQRVFSAIRYALRYHESWMSTGETGGSALHRARAGCSTKAWEIPLHSFWAIIWSRQIMSDENCGQ